MNVLDWIQPVLYVVALAAISPYVGSWMHRLLNPRADHAPRLMDRAGEFVVGKAWHREMNWRSYLNALLIFNLMGFLLLLGLQLWQSQLPGNPAKLADVPFALALNTAISFVTNTNWQAYSGEATMSYLTQMAGLGVQNFLSAATGLAVLLALARGLASKSGESLGNFWRDAVRGTLYILLPLSAILAMVLVSQGVVQTFDDYTTITTLEGKEQVIPLGPAASQIAIKQLGTNGGGFFGVNSAHPFENPTPLSNFLQVFAILILPAACVFLFAEMIGSRRHGWVIFGTMLGLLAAGFALALWAEMQPNPSLGTSAMLEGKETRFGVMNSVLWSATTTAASNGSVNAMHDSFSPLAGGVAMFNMMLGEVIFGGIGAGLYGMLMFVVLTVFLAGLMVGRSPEYLGKKIEIREVIFAVIAVLLPCVILLTGAAISCRSELGLSSLTNKGPHGLSEIVYAWASAAGNNGSAFGGLSANTTFYNYGLAIAMFLGRFGIIIPALAIAGSMAAKKSSPPSAGTFPTDGATFGLLLGSVIVVVGGLTFVPVLSLGPIIEHFLLSGGATF